MQIPVWRFLRWWLLRLGEISRTANNRQNNWCCRQAIESRHSPESFSAGDFCASSKSKDFWGWIIMKLLFLSRSMHVQPRMPQDNDSPPEIRQCFYNGKYITVYNTFWDFNSNFRASWALPVKTETSFLLKPGAPKRSRLLSVQKVVKNCKL